MCLLFYNWAEKLLIFYRKNEKIWIINALEIAVPELQPHSPQTMHECEK